MKLMLASMVCILLVSTALAVKYIQQTRRAEEHSAAAGTPREVCQLLGEHRSRFGSLPESIEELPLTFSDGGTPDLLSRLTYAPRATAALVQYTFASGETMSCAIP